MLARLTLSIGNCCAKSGPGYSLKRNCLAKVPKKIEKLFNFPVLVVNTARPVTVAIRTTKASRNETV